MVTSGFLTELNRQGRMGEPAAHAVLIVRSLDDPCAVPVDLGIRWIVFPRQHVLNPLYNASEVPAAARLCYTLVNGYRVAERFEETLFNHLPFVPRGAAGFIRD